MRKIGMLRMIPHRSYCLRVTWKLRRSHLKRLVRLALQLGISLVVLIKIALVTLGVPLAVLAVQALEVTSPAVLLAISEVPVVIHLEAQVKVHLEAILGVLIPSRPQTVLIAPSIVILLRRAILPTIIVPRSISIASRSASQVMARSR